MKKDSQLMSLEDIKKTELSILDYVVGVCDDNNLSYFLAYGTLIGAIRHKGFIPWDDDIDIVMPRQDYNKFIEVVKQFPNYRFNVCVPNENGFYYEFIKVFDSITYIVEDADIKDCPNGVWIDIFPLDGLNPDDKWAHRLLLVGQRCRVASIYNSFPHKMGKKLAPIEWIFWKCCKVIGYKNILNKTLKWSQKYNYGECEIVGYASSFPAHNKYMKKEWFQECVLVEFEGKYYKAPKYYHDYLTTQYGDYMQLPPEDKRITHHMKAYRIQL